MGDRGQRETAGLIRVINWREYSIIKVAAAITAPSPAGGFWHVTQVLAWPCGGGDRPGVEVIVSRRYGKNPGYSSIWTK